MMIANKTFESIKIIFISMWEKDKTQLLMKIESYNCYLKGIISKNADVYFWLTAADGSVQSQPVLESDIRELPSLTH